MSSVPLSQGSQDALAPDHPGTPALQAPCVGGAPVPTQVAPAPREPLRAELPPTACPAGSREGLLQDGLSSPFCSSPRLPRRLLSPRIPGPGFAEQRLCLRDQENFQLDLLQLCLCALASCHCCLIKLAFTRTGASTKWKGQYFGDLYQVPGLGWPPPSGCSELGESDGLA